MLKEHATVFRRLMIVVDIFLGMAAFLIGYFLRSNMAGKLFPLGAYIHILPALLLIWATLLYFLGMYSSFRLKSIPQILWIILKAMTLGFFLFGSLGYIFKLQDISRSFVVIVFVLMAVFLMVEKIVLILIFRSLRKSGFNFRDILIVGSGERAQKFIKQVNKQREFGLRIIGVVDEHSEKLGGEICGCKALGTIEDIPEILKKNPVDHVVFIVPRSLLDKIEQVILHCETVGVAVSVAVDLFELKFTLGKEGSLLGLPMITFESTPDKLWQLLCKRIIDVVLSSAGLFFLFPFYMLIAILVKTTSPGPVYFIQERCGLQGRRFKLYKFRTMEKGAEAKLHQLLAHNEMRGPAFKMKDDPRVTKIGKILRKTSMDELPQLWNVLKGEMSLVGPRPPLPSEVKEYDHWHRRRLSMRPGITCLWQISGRNNIIDFDEWMKLDMHYIDHWSLGLDFDILFKTVPVVAFGVGAK